MTIDSKIKVPSMADVRPCAGSGKPRSHANLKRAVTELHFATLVSTTTHHNSTKPLSKTRDSFCSSSKTTRDKPISTPHPSTTPPTTMGSVVIPHLVTGWHVDQAIMSEEDRLVVIRFGRDWDPDCMRQDEVLYKIADRVKNFAVIYVCDLDQVPDFKQMYELYDTVTMMFFFRNKHMMCDFGTGNNNKLNWVLEDKQELIDIIETIYKGAKKGRGLVVSPKDYSTRYRY